MLITLQISINPITNMNYALIVISQLFIIGMNLKNVQNNYVQIYFAG